MRTFIADRGTGEPISLGAALIAGKKVAPDVTDLLAEDHRVVLGWFEWYERAQEPALRDRIVAKIVMALRAHMRGEESVLYPAARLQANPALVDRAVAEHEGAKRLMEQLDTLSAADPAQAELVAQLEAEIRAHVDEEENELFPAVRQTDMDLYAVGRALAAARVDSLFKQIGSGGRELKEYPNMQISMDEARDYFIQGLKNAHATTLHGRKLVEAQVERVQNYPNIKAKLESHLNEKNAQIERLEQLLDGYGEKPSGLKDTAMAAAAGVAGMAAAAADDEIIKNGFATLAQAKYEAAAYETLLLFGAAAGETEALKPLQKSLSESRGLATFVEENLRATGMRFLQLRSEGAQASH